MGIKELKGGVIYLIYYELIFICIIVYLENSFFDKLYCIFDRKDKYDGYLDDMLFSNCK